MLSTGLASRSVLPSVSSSVRRFRFRSLWAVRCGGVDDLHGTIRYRGDLYSWAPGRSRIAVVRAALEVGVVRHHDGPPLETSCHDCACDEARPAHQLSSHCVFLPSAGSARASRCRSCLARPWAANWTKATPLLVEEPRCRYQRASRCAATAKFRATRTAPRASPKLLLRCAAIQTRRELERTIDDVGLEGLPLNIPGFRDRRDGGPPTLTDGSTGPPTRRVGLSLDPLLMIVSVDKNTRCHGQLHAARRFGANFSARSRRRCRRCSRSAATPNRVDSAACPSTPARTVHRSSAIAYLECKVADDTRAATTTCLSVRRSAARSSAPTPLRCCSSGVGTGKHRRLTLSPLRLAFLRNATSLGVAGHHVLGHHPAGVGVGVRQAEPRAGGRTPPCRWRSSVTAWCSASATVVVVELQAVRGTTRSHQPDAQRLPRRSTIRPVRSISIGRWRPRCAESATSASSRRGPMLTPGVAKRADAPATARSQRPLRAGIPWRSRLFHPARSPACGSRTIDIIHAAGTGRAEPSS